MPLVLLRLSLVMKAYVVEDNLCMRAPQNINFMGKLEFTDDRLHSILLLKFVQVRPYYILHASEHLVF
jgi:hypothetical protein